jgi:hypothetical protein
MNTIQQQYGVFSYQHSGDRFAKGLPIYDDGEGIICVYLPTELN